MQNYRNYNYRFIINVRGHSTLFNLLLRNFSQLFIAYSREIIYCENTVENEDLIRGRSHFYVDNYDSRNNNPCVSVASRMRLACLYLLFSFYKVPHFPEYLNVMDMCGSQCFYVFSCKLSHKHVHIHSLCNMKICSEQYERYRKSFAEYSARMNIKFSTRFSRQFVMILMDS